MEEYFKKGKIDNPLNIKRVGGELTTTKSSPKNVLLLFGVFSILALTFNQVWAYTIMFLRSPILAGILLGLIYGVIILKTISVTILEEKKQVKAYKDLLDNRFSDLAVIWEIQDIREENVLGENIAYIDYINGTRTMLLKCVPGSVLNLEDDTPKYHYNAISRVLDYIDDLGYSWDIHVVEESISDDKALNFYYENLKNYQDRDFIDIFTEQLDTIAYSSEMYSAIHVIYIEINGIGKYKHNMVKNLSVIPEIMGDNHIFKEVGLVNRKIDIDTWVAYINAVSMFDREELIMNKYKNQFNLRLTAVLGAFDTDGKLLKRFNPDFDIKKSVRKKSIDTVAKDNKQKRKPNPKNKNINNQVINDKGEIIIPNLDDYKHKKLIELLYSKDKVKLGD